MSNERRLLLATMLNGHNADISFVSRQQELELAIKKCTTQAELDAIEITYDPVLTAYLAEAGKEVVS